jgi:hypothetical protein
VHCMRHTDTTHRPIVHCMRDVRVARNLWVRWK